MPHNHATRAFAIIGRALLDIIRAVEDGNPALDVEDVLICFAVVVGFSEDRPMTCSKVAAYTNIPRPTVIRRVKRLVGLGLIEIGTGKGLLAPQDHIAGEAPSRAAKQQIRIVLKAAETLSKMDT